MADAASARIPEQLRLELLDDLAEFVFFGLYALVLGLAVYRFPRYYDTPARYLPVFFAYTLLTETVGIIVRDYDAFSIVIREMYYNNNWLIYNIYSLVLVVFFYILYHRYITALRMDWVKAAGLGLFVGVSLWNAWRHDFSTVSQAYAYTAGGVLLIVSSAGYLFQEFHLANRDLFWRDLLVWISIGLLVFHLGYLPINLHRFQVAVGEAEYAAWTRPAHLALIYCMYGCFLVGFIRMKRLRKPGNRNHGGNGGNNGSSP